MQEFLDQMLQAGVHYGHRVRHWNPKMTPYIYEEKNGVHVLDLVQTESALETARRIFQKSQNVIFVGTKPHIKEIVQQIANQCGAHYVNKRWVGGLLTNWLTVSSCITALKELKKILEEDPKLTGFTKRELAEKQREFDRKERFFGGVLDLQQLPDLVVIVGQRREQNAVLECQKLNIPTITLLDTNCDPSQTTYGIPANDDSVHSVELILKQLVT